MYVVDDEEIALYTRSHDLPTRVEDFVELILKHQRYFAFFLLFFFFIEVIFGFLLYGQTDRDEEEVKAIIKGMCYSYHS